MEFSYFSISIAIEAEGEIVAGVVADLSSNDIFDAVKATARGATTK